MPRNRTHARALRTRSAAIRDPDSRYVNLCIRLRIKDGPRAGERTRPYGGIWDRKANRGQGEFVSYYDPLHGWTGDVPSRIHDVWVSRQQLPFVTDFLHRVTMALGGRRSGKTAAAGIKCVILALCFAGLPGCVISPTYRQSKNVWKAILRATPRAWLKPGTAGINKTDRILRFANGSTIVFLSADRDDSARSEGCAWLVLDERQDISEEAFGNAYLSASEGGDQYVVNETATIKPGLRPHYDALIADPNSAVYAMKSRWNPFISKALFDNAIKLLDAATIQRELEAEWPADHLRIYYPFRGDMIVSYPAHNREDITASELHGRFDTPAFGDHAAKYYISIDPPVHAVIWKLYRDGTMHAIDEICIGADGAEGDVRDLAKACFHRYSPAVIVVDPHETGYSSDVKRYFKTHNAFRFTSMPRTSIEYRLTSVRARMEAGKFLVDPKCKFLIEALKEHKKAETTGKPDKHQRSKIDDRFNVDHIADAFGYGVYKLYPARYDYIRNEQKAA